jgi:coproporphyrinogen III oxidase-like Fe-S oxidoreductase
MLGLRTSDGVDLAEIDRTHGTNLGEANTALIDELLRQGRLDQIDGRLKPTLSGLATADSLALAFEICEVS